MGHNVSSNQIVSQPRNTDFVDIPDTKQSNNVIAGSNNSVPSKSGSSNETYSNLAGVVRITEYDVKMEHDLRICNVTGCGFLDDGSLILTDYTNKRLKKITNQRKVSFVDLPDQPSDMCHLGNGTNKVVACGGQTLHFVSIKGNMKVTRSVNLVHNCNGITYQDNHIYVVDDTSVYRYTIAGEKGLTLYKDKSAKVRFCHICANGKVLYITDEYSGLVTIDTTGKVLAKFTDPELTEAQGVCVDSEDNVLVSGFESDTVIKVDSSGRKKLGTVIRDSGDISDPKCLCFVKERLQLYVGQWNDKLTVFQM